MSGKELLPPGEGRVRCSLSIDEGELILHMYREPFEEPPPEIPPEEPPEIPRQRTVGGFLRQLNDPDFTPLERPPGTPGAAIAHLLGEYIGRRFSTLELAACVYPDVMKVRDMNIADARKVVFRATAKVCMAIGRPFLSRCLWEQGLFVQKGVCESLQGRPPLLYRSLHNDEPYIIGDDDSGPCPVRWKKPVLPHAS